MTSLVPSCCLSLLAAAILVGAGDFSAKPGGQSETRPLQAVTLQAATPMSASKGALLVGSMVAGAVFLKRRRRHWVK